MRTALYWSTRWTPLTALVAFFVIAALLPPFTWWLRTPLLIGLTFVAWVVAWGIQANIAERKRIERSLGRGDRIT
jgi:hypothetical protein